MTTFPVPPSTYPFTGPSRIERFVLGLARGMIGVVERRMARRAASRSALHGRQDEASESQRDRVAARAVGMLPR